jgi:hypothetical protein
VPWSVGKTKLVPIVADRDAAFHFAREKEHELVGLVLHGDHRTRLEDAASPHLTEHDRVARPERHRDRRYAG